MKGFADVVDKDSFSDALLTKQQSFQQDPPGSQLVAQSFSEQSHETLTDEYGPAVKRKRYQNTSTGSGGSQSKSLSHEPFHESIPPAHSPQSRREIFQVSREGTASSFRYFIYVIVDLKLSLLKVYYLLIGHQAALRAIPLSDPRVV